MRKQYHLVESVEYHPQNMQDSLFAMAREKGLILVSYLRKPVVLRGL
jgi:diketogulonate reductase-like aldo/keto reductase